MRDELKYVLGEKKFPVKKKGSTGKLVRLIQEWLCLNNLPVVIDGIYGPATKRAVEEFQMIKILFDNGHVDSRTFAKLVAPMRRVLKHVTADYDSTKEFCDPLANMVLAYARLHLKQYPREVGGQNRGPWVRLYMKGLDGKRYPWCAGFVSFITQQATKALGVIPLFSYTWSVPVLARIAKQKGIFLSGRKGKPYNGYIFLKRSKKGYSHCGFVNKAEDDIFKSIEGNTNDDGSAEGYEVCARIRSYKNKDYVAI